MAARAPNEKDLITQTNGDPLYLGSIVSTGAAVNNATTTTPFNQAGLGPANSSASPLNLSGTLAGKTLLLQTSAAGLINTSASPSMSGTAPFPVVAQQTTMPPATGTVPGVSLVSGERVVVIMMPFNGWIQWLPASGSANLHVWELR